MTFAISILKDTLDNRSKRMLAALKRANRSSGSDHEYYAKRYIELEKQVKDLERAVALLTEKQEEKK